MIHHCEIVAVSRRVTVLPTVPEPRAAWRFPGTWISIAVISLLLSGAETLGAQAAPAKPTPAGASAPAATPAAPVRNISWTSARRSFAVGDIIKVIVDEHALASASKDNNSSASRSRNMSVGIEPPSTGGASIGNISGKVGTGDAGQSRQQGVAARDTRYVGEIPVRVVAVTPEGLLQVKGTKTIDVDKNQQTLTLSGVIRPIDVTASDAIGSDMIADAQLSYQSKGSLGKPKNGILTKLVGVLWP